MNVLLISYGIREYDGRLSELYELSKHLGEVTFVSCGISPSDVENEKIILKKKHKYMGVSLYLKFLYTSLITAKKMKSIDIIICDNFFASIPVLLINKLLKPKRIIQDVRELYFYEEAKSISGKLFSKFETKLMKKANIVLCANNERSEIMFSKFNLRKKPLVFENIRTLKGSFNSKVLDEKYINDFNYKINIVSTGGISVLRTTDKLVNAMSKLPSNYGLYIIGGGEESDKKIIQDIIEKHSLKNVKLISKVPLNELRYIVRNADIGIVNYHQLDLNNKYCASGKIYEYLGEGVPIVTTENPPLKQLCDNAKIGEADDFYYKGIMKVATNLSEYKENVEIYMKNISVEKYNENTARKIKNSFKDMV
ncbi:hypothetical protein [Sporosarcina luteola]|uniref:hypothetical protein n=1 Tax=Sporosarcina luteola TaxID=582850 RepID=UPI002040E25A|nr:hypothetical protein [Sporosarcina luteola]MCM3709210.1 hypothetical protein [Sporosarcina luteola]